MLLPFDYIRCWCDNEIGHPVTEQVCENPEPCTEEQDTDCLADGEHWPVDLYDTQYSKGRRDDLPRTKRLLHNPIGQSLIIQHRTCFQTILLLGVRGH